MTERVSPRAQETCLLRTCTENSQLPGSSSSWRAREMSPELLAPGRSCLLASTSTGLPRTNRCDTVAANTSRAVSSFGASCRTHIYKKRKVRRRKKEKKKKEEKKREGGEEKNEM